MTFSSVFRLFLPVVLIAAFNPFFVRAQTVFRHFVVKPNSLSYIDHPATNEKPDKILIVSQDWGDSGPYNPSEIYVSYEKSKGKWYINNANFKAIPKGARFNIMVLNPGQQAFSVSIVVDPDNKAAGRLDHPALTDHPEAKFLITPGSFNLYPYAIRYKGRYWTVENLGGEAILPNTVFNIYLHQDIFKHKSTGSNISGSWTYLDKSGCGNQGLLFVTRVLSHNGVKNPHPIGVWNHKGRWTIFNEDEAYFPENSEYNVLCDYANAVNSGSLKKIAVTLLGISIDDHPENVWGQVDFALYESDIDGNNKRLVKTIDKLNAAMNWSASEGESIGCVPYPGNDNIKRTIIVELEPSKIKNGQYFLVNSCQLNTTHKDNFMAVPGRHYTDGTVSSEANLGDLWKEAERQMRGEEGLETPIHGDYVTKPVEMFWAAGRYDTVTDRWHGFHVVYEIKEVK